MKKVIILMIITILTLSYRVKASTLSIPVTKYQSSYFTLTNQLEQVSYGYKIPLTRSSTPNSVNNIFLQFSNAINGSQFDYIQFDFLLGLPQYSELNNDSTITGRYCYEYLCSDWDNNNTVCAEWYCSNVRSYTEGTINNNEIYPLTLNDLNFSVRMEYTDGNFAFCDIQNGKIICPTNRSSSIKGIDLYYNFRSDHIANASMILYQATEYYKISDNQAIIDNQNHNTQQILEQNATYQDTPSKDLTNETQEINDYSQAEENLINSLDFNMTTLDGITINPNASSYIWQIVERLRQINPAIILLMTSILGMGIIKMVLNR